MIKMLKAKYINYLSIISITLFFNTCNLKSQNFSTCKSEMKKCYENTNQYLKTFDKSLLQNALTNLNTSIKCKETRIESINKKIEIYGILFDFENGYKFTDSLQINDFDYSYKKEFTKLNFLRLKFEINGDDSNKIICQEKAIVIIENYIKQELKLKNEFNESIIFNYLLLKKELLGNNEFDMEINNQILIFPSKKDFFEKIKHIKNDTNFTISNKTYNLLN